MLHHRKFLKLVFKNEIMRPFAGRKRLNNRQKETLGDLEPNRRFGVFGVFGVQNEYFGFHSTDIKSEILFLWSETQNIYFGGAKFAPSHCLRAIFRVLKVSERSDGNVFKSFSKLIRTRAHIFFGKC